MTKKVAIYARISTDGQTIEQQIDSCKKYCELKGLEVAETISETGSGKDILGRPKFQELWNRLRTHGFDGVVVFRIDRLGRNVRDMVMFFDEMQSEGIQVHSVNENLDIDTPIGKAVINILITMAQLEREQISFATKQRLQALKKMGKTLGRPKGSKDKHQRRKSGYHRRWDKKSEVKKQSLRMKQINKGGVKNPVLPKDIGLESK